MLNQDQRNALASLVKHPGFVLIEQLEEDAANALGKELLKADLSNPEEIKLIRENQIYMKARKDFLVRIKNNTIDITENNIKLF